MVAKRPEDLAGYYDVHYYANYAGGQTYSRESPIWQEFFGVMADRIIAEIRPRSVLDVGCSVGVLVEALRDRGVEAWGIDISEYAIDHVRPDIRPYCRVASITDDLQRWYDLIVCLEVIEHLPEEQVHDAVANVATHTAQVLFGSTPDDFGDPSHFNVKPSDYWVGLFARHSIYRDVEFDGSYISPHAMLLRRAHDPAISVIRAYERKAARLERQVAEVRSVNMNLVQELNRLKETTKLGSPAERLAWARRLLGNTNARRYRIARSVVHSLRRIRAVFIQG
jgi:2-polyprenyl-3-methyl-5-hydroxy-6-metoxy-1,4-benzoquinol methylase